MFRVLGFRPGEGSHCMGLDSYSKNLKGMMENQMEKWGTQIASAIVELTG